jgi:hypothetical protein
MAIENRTLNDWLWSRVGERWFATPRAVQIFSWAFLASVGATIGVGLPDFSEKIDSMPGSLYLFVHTLYVLFAAVLPFGAIFLFLGMFRYWSRLDDSPKSVRTKWFWVLLLGTWLGACFYFVYVYSRRWGGGEIVPMNGMRRIVRFAWGMVFVGFIFMILFVRVRPLALPPVVLVPAVLLLIVLSISTVFAEIRRAYSKGMEKN